MGRDSCEGKGEGGARAREVESVVLQPSRSDHGLLPMWGAPRMLDLVAQSWTGNCVSATHMNPVSKSTLLLFDPPPQSAGPPPEGSGAQTTMRKREAKAEAACTTPRRTCSTPATTCLSPMTPSPQVPSLLDTPSSSCAQPCRDVVADFPAFRQRVQGLLDRAERLEGGPHWATLTRAYRELEERLLAGAHAPVGLPPPVRGKGSGSKRTKYSPHKHAKRRLL